MKTTMKYLAVIMLLCSCSTRSGEFLDGGMDAVTTGVDSTFEEDLSLPVADLHMETAPPPPLDWQPCEVRNWPRGYPTPPVGTVCAFISVPLDHGDPNGTTVSIRVARQTSTAYPSGKAVFVLEGGPGGSAVFTSGMIPKAMPDLRNSFDLIYVDQRGTGGSGYLSCPVPPRTKEDWNVCAVSHADKDLNLYVTEQVVHDLEAVRARLGYDKIYLFGVSYGTRIAFDYIRLYEDKVAAAILDGVAPPPADLFSDSIASFDRGIALLISDCQMDPACLAVSPNLTNDLTSKREALKTAPRAVLIQGKAAYEYEKDYEIALKALLKQSYWRYRIPKAIHQAVQGNHFQWNQLMSEVFSVPVSDNTGTSPPAMRNQHVERFSARTIPDSWGTPFDSPAVNMTMLCAEVLPNSDGVGALNDQFAQQTWPNHSIMERVNACPSWPIDPLPAPQRQFVSSTAKILLLSGAIDINVDPKWAEAAIGHLSTATHIIVPFSAHLVTYVSCVGEINAAFFDADGEIAEIDTSCLNTLASPGWN